MELSPEVVQGLNYLANGSYISEDNYKKIVNSSLGLLAGQPNIERVSTICPEKGEIIKQIYGCLLTFTVEVIRNNALEEVKTLLSKQNFKQDRIDYFTKVLNYTKDSIIESLKNCQGGWPNIVDTDWRLDYVIKSNTHNHIGEPLYYIVLTVEKDGKLDYIKFTCDLHQIQDLSTKLKEIVWITIMDAWNCWDLKPPPFCTVKMVLHSKEVKSLAELVFEASETLSNCTSLSREAALLSRILYKNKRMLRHEKAFQNLSKINQSLKRYLKLNLLEALENLKISLPKHIHSAASHAYLPTRQMLKWVLVRLLAFSQLFLRVINLTKDTGTLLYKKLHLGWHINLTLVTYSLTARILVCAKFLVLKSIEWYNALYKFLPYLEETAEFLPQFIFPNNLKQWLGEVDLSLLRKKTSIDEVFEVIDMLKDEEEVRIVSENLFRHFRVEVKEDSDIEEVKIEEPERILANVVEDLGVSVKEEEEERMKKLWMKKKEKKKKMGKKFKKEMKGDGGKRRRM